MSSTGVPPGNLEIRELLLPIIDGLPDQLCMPDNVRLVLREIDRFLGNVGASFAGIGKQLPQDSVLGDFAVPS
jgi:hypothetical protein